MAPDGMSHPGYLEGSIILLFENCTISFDMSTIVVQTISDGQLRTELAYSHKGKCTKKWSEASAEPPVKTTGLDSCSKTMGFVGVKMKSVEFVFRQPSPDNPREGDSSQETSSGWMLFLIVLFPERVFYNSFLNILNGIEAFLSNSHALHIKKIILNTSIREYPIDKATVDSDLLQADNTR